MMSSNMSHFTMFLFILILVVAETYATPFTSSALDSTVENLNEDSSNNDCRGKPFGTPCSFMNEIGHPTGYCDNSICIRFAVDLNDGKCDEEEFGSGEWKCRNGECIDFEWICDGENDCYDGEDEEHCNDSEQNFL